MLDDIELLSRYTSNRDELAFTELVRRHLGIVYGVAMRDLGDDAHLATDVAQTVFTDLGRKAPSVEGKLRRGQPLVGWLYTSTHYAAARMRRTEKRRQHHETAAFTMSERMKSSGPDPSWEEIRPLLNEAMNQLKETDRDAVLLRYFSGKDLRSVGLALGLTDDAARKRIDRALDRLRAWFVTRGIATTGAALSAVLAANAIGITPVGLAEKVARAAHRSVISPSMESAAAFSTLSLPKWFPAAVGILIFGTLALLSFLALMPTRTETRLELTPALEATVGAPDELQVAAAKAGPSNLGSQSVSTYIKVPKTFLYRVLMPALVMTNTQSRQFALTEKFVRALRLTPSEAERVEASVAKALHHYRLEEGNHLEFLSMEVSAPIPLEPVRVLEQANFRLAPFREEALEIKRILEADILNALGQQRADLFRQFCLLFHGEMSLFEPQESQPDNADNLISYSFRLVEGISGPQVDLFRQTTSGYNGTYFDAPLDVYAPKRLRPVLEQWRKWIKSRNKGEDDVQANSTQFLNAEDPITPQPRIAESTHGKAESPAWDETAEDIDLPSNLIESLGFVGLNDDETVSTDAIMLCELSESDAHSINELYATMKARFIDLESKHFQAIQGKPGNFVLQAFPNESLALREQWREELFRVVGETRGPLLDLLIRTRMHIAQRMRLGLDPRILMNPPVDWLHSGTEELVVEILPGPRIQFRASSNVSLNGSFGPVRPDRIPTRWRHLLTPEILSSNSAPE
jgi:RNA polymerase sigma factor (sigma-70 family)